MPTAVDNAKAIQDKALAGLQATQEAVVQGVRSWAETVETIFSRGPELLFGSAPLKPNEVVDTTLRFTEAVFNSQREFASRLFDAAVPATRAPAAGAQGARAAGAQPKP